jgi:hypothetical protein
VERQSIGAPESPLEVQLSRAIELDKQGKELAALRLLYPEIEAKLRSGEFDECDALLRGVKPEDLSVNLILGLLSATFPGSHKLPARGEFFKRAWRVVEHRGRDADKLLSKLESWSKIDGTGPSNGDRAS